MDPIYSAENTKAAYQLNWSVALFGSNEVPSSTDWLPQLKSATEPDGVRILECHWPSSSVDLSSRRTGNYGQYVHSLQIVLENSDDWHEVREKVLLGSRNMILGCAAKKGWLLSRIGILSNHIHILVGIGVNESPESAALSLLNNLAFAQGWKPVFRFSYYAGTFGGYDRDAIRRAVKEA